MSIQRLAEPAVPVVENRTKILHSQDVALESAGGCKVCDRERAANLVLAQETDHRLKNTIQSIASLLMLQARVCAHPDARAALEDAHRRLGIFITVQGLLHGNGTGDRAVDLAVVIQTLAEALRMMFSDRVVLRVVADQVVVESQVAIPLSLLVNEAVTNAFKHAYPDGRSGEIFVRVAKIAGGGLRIGIQDDGVGFSPNVCHDTLGLTLMRTFASQIGGHLAVLADAGTTIQLTVLDGVTTRPNGHLGAGHPDGCARPAGSNHQPMDPHF